MGMWDGLKNVIYEFFHAGEMNENARNFLVAKGMKYLIKFSLILLIQWYFLMVKK